MSCSKRTRHGSLTVQAIRQTHTIRLALGDKEVNVSSVDRMWHFHPSIRSRLYEYDTLKCSFASAKRVWCLSFALTGASKPFSSQAGISRM